MITAPALAADSGGKYIAAQLIAQTSQPRPGATVLIGITMDPRPGWHGYWSNPGDAGIAPTVEWTAPKGVTFGPLHHPAPTLMMVGNDASFVHKGRHVLLVPMTVSARIRPGTPLPVTARLLWGSCTDRACVPERATLSLRLVAGNGKPRREIRILAAAKAMLPKPARPSTYAIDKSSITLTLPRSLALDHKTTRFFPENGDYYDAASARSRVAGRSILISAARRSIPPRLATGVVSDGRRAYRITFRRR